jgi:hypothetical protein
MIESSDFIVTLPEQLINVYGTIKKASIRIIVNH